MGNAWLRALPRVAASAHHELQALTRLLLERGNPWARKASLMPMTVRGLKFGSLEFYTAVHRSVSAASLSRAAPLPARPARPAGVPARPTAHCLGVLVGEPAEHPRGPREPRLRCTGSRQRRAGRRASHPAWHPVAPVLAGPSAPGSPACSRLLLPRDDARWRRNAFSFWTVAVQSERMTASRRSAGVPGPAATTSGPRPATPRIANIAAVASQITG